MSAVAEERAPRQTSAGAVTGLLRAMRPRHWTKNLLVLVPLLPAGSALRQVDPLDVLLAFAAFCLISSSVYLVNDARDVESDRAHPVKRYRPLAAGVVPIPLAVVAAVVLAAAAFALSAAVNVPLLVTVATYYGIQLAYCFGLKHEPVLELACVASGFMLRALAGGVAVDIPLSSWFLLTAAFGSLYMAAGKRYGEARMGERTGARVRRVVQRYTMTFLRFVWTLSATVVVLTYSLWSFEVSQRTESVFSAVSVVPFTLAILRFGINVDAGTAEEPDEIVVHDRVLLALGLLWAVLFAAAVYL
ncbi:decaprenyl-phosphate phosphoribosyltransferase [Geodermatophilus africanus]|uniref:Decaprenyl-phosphate phosphoribosyltransferase n=1 Tax=Geodermatophilus africanus TaxID=1137993 RepID=A0A1H3EC30_9ACTN|nr:decaprenyl-phosphate phosphoribosyltransferase [Geodermatophilus africanus]SDX76312.1 decaprenyl-phosphate phosphoribosyltransferase [Geodermatophilus africanus]